MRMNTLLSAAICVAAMGIAGVRGDEPTLKGDLAKLQGQWTATFGPQNTVVVVTIKGTAVTLSMRVPDGPAFDSSGEIKVDENARPHKTLDWLNFSTADGQTARPNLGIYKLDGDSITICNGGPGNERPTEFKAGEKGKPQLFVLNRKPAGGGSGTETASPGASAAPSGDLAKLQGRWSAKVGADQQATLGVTIQGTSVVLSIPTAEGAPREVKGEIKIDETAKPHKTLDWVNFTNRSGQPAPANLAIYRLSGDTLTICSGGAGNARPTEFKAGEGNRPSLIVLSRN
jgi:uncharacterized protein (TIGR03067 family)